MLVKCLHKKLYPRSCKVDSLKRLRLLPGVETFIKIRPLSAWANIWRACSVALSAPSTNRFYLESRAVLSTSNYPSLGCWHWLVGSLCLAITKLKGSFSVPIWLPWGRAPDSGETCACLDCLKHKCAFDGQSFAWGYVWKSHRIYLFLLNTHFFKKWLWFMIDNFLLITYTLIFIRGA